MNSNETALQRIMEAEGRSFAWLARTVGVSRGTVDSWKRGHFHPTDANREAIVHALRRTEEVEDLIAEFRATGDEQLGEAA